MKTGHPGLVCTIRMNVGPLFIDPMHRVFYQFIPSPRPSLSPLPILENQETQGLIPCHLSNDVPVCGERHSQSLMSLEFLAFFASVNLVQGGSLC